VDWEFCRGPLPYFLTPGQLAASWLILTRSKPSCELEREDEGVCGPESAALAFHWKDPDPDIPILKQAKAEYARL
jgi:hypothetical protein